MAQSADVAREQELLASTGEGDIELSVDEVSVLDEAVRREEVELIALLDGERIDDDVALRPLVALDGVDADVEERRDAEAFDLLADHRDLVAVGHDDADGLVGIEA